MAPGQYRRSKTSRFPVARIKKIMQMDEEVGKLAGATPVMISKTVECFLQTLIEETTKEARSRGSKKLTSNHLKYTINSNPNFDFLLDIASKIPDAPIPGDPSSASSSGPSRSKTKTSIDPSISASGSKRRKTNDGNTPISPYNSQAPTTFGGMVPSSSSGSIGGRNAGGTKNKSKNTGSLIVGGSRMKVEERDGEDDYDDEEEADYDQMDQVKEERNERIEEEEDGGKGKVVIPDVETWKRDMEGGGGRGEGGRGMYDDYEDDEDDY